jgi:hypothetical protein
MRDLPSRRGHTVVDLVWRPAAGGEHKFKLGCGRELDPRGNIIGPVLEVFADSPKFGTEMAHTLRDCCKLISFMLRAGWSARAIADKLNGTRPVDADGKPSDDPESGYVRMLQPDSVVGFVALGAAAQDGDQAARTLLASLQQLVVPA